MSKDISIFIDSGAFSAKTQGVQIKVQDYIQFIKDNEQYIDLYANLDVIGDPKSTLHNQRIMERAGLHPMPVFHYGEDVSYLQRYLFKYDYIALGGLVGGTSKVISEWLDPLWSEYICDGNGLPKVKIHGFGLTSLRLMLRYPWYSVDSTSWVVTARLGSVYVPRFSEGKYIYDEDSWKVSVSSRSPDKKEQGQHIDTFTPGQREAILSYFESKGYVLGKSEFRKEKDGYKLKEGERWFGKARDGYRELELVVEPGLSNQYILRDELNIIYFNDLEKSMPEWPWSFTAGQNVKKGFGI